MKILVDTCVWSLALRRTRATQNMEAVVQELRELIGDARVQMVGPVRQEVLSGIRDNAHFSALRNRLREFPDLAITSTDHELAAELFNRIRSKGIQGSNTDMLLCALSIHHVMPIFTTDVDFIHYQKHVPIRLHRE